MTKEELINELKDWVEADMPLVWFRINTRGATWTLNNMNNNNSWGYYGQGTYIIDDERAKERKEKIDKEISLS
jgi:hypothetical protein